MTIETYPAMNIEIVKILRLSNDASLIYAAQRIEELETANTHLERLEAASQRILARVMHENRVHAECLAIAKKALGYANGRNDTASRCNALEEIARRLAELEPEEETG